MTERFSFQKNQSVSTTNFPLEEPIETDSIITPLALECGYKVVEILELHHFEPKPPRYICTWPRDSRLNNTQRRRALREKVGFSYICFPQNSPFHQFLRALEVGFTHNKIMFQVFPDNYQTIINTYGNIYGYYLDEPFSNGFDPYITYYIKDYIVSKNYNSLLLAGDLKRTFTFQATTVPPAERVLFTDYKKWCLFFGYWISCCPVDTDQRSNWSDFKNNFGNKFSSTWVGAHNDLQEYYQLMGHAANLNLDIVWLWQMYDATDDYSDNNVSTFCNAAWNAGYLKRFSEKILIEYKCIGHTVFYPCQCSSSNPECFWIENKRIYTGIIREDFPVPH